MKVPRGESLRNSSGMKIVRPTMERGENEALWREVRKFAALIPTEADPNLGRVREIKEEIQKGEYPTAQMIDETATRLAARFMNRE